MSLACVCIHKIAFIENSIIRGDFEMENCSLVHLNNVPA